jgi:segregation and condensation protein B
MSPQSADRSILENIVEALIFAANESLSEPVICRIVEAVDEEVAARLSELTVEAIIDRLNEQYEARGRAFRIHRWAEGYRMATVSEVAPYLEAMFSDEQEQTLSQSLMETLAIVAYQQPVTRPEVDYVRGVDAGYALRKLMERSFIEVVGRGDSVGRPLLYGTTDFFLEQFGLNSLEDLPKPREIDELLEDPAFQNEKAKLFMAEGIMPGEGDSAREASEQITSNGADYTDDGDKR